MIKLYRKLWRLLGLIFPVLYFFISREWMIGILAVVTGLFFAFEIYRFGNKSFNRKLFKKYKYLLKDEEKGRITSSTWFLLASLICVIFFAKNYAILAIFFSNLGNLAAVFAGVLFGRFAKGYKNVEGSIGMLVICVIIGLVAFFAGFIELGVMLVGAFAATLTELFTKGPYDNLTVSIVSALVMSLV